MAGNVNNIIATTAAGGTGGTGLAWFAPLGTTGPVAVAYTAEVQTIANTGTPTGGSFTPTWHGVALAAQAYNVPTATLATAMNAAWSAYLLGGTILVTGTAGTTYTVTFPSQIGNAPAITVTYALTGGSTPTTTVTETTPGAGANPATAAIPAAFKDSGIIEASSGLGITYADTTKEIDGFGLSSAARILFTKTVVSFDVTFLETNHTSLEIFHRLPIGATGTAGTDGFISGVVDGPPVIVQYSAIFDMVDGINHYRGYAPIVQNTSKGKMTLPFGDAITRQVTLTAFPDTNNNSVYWYPVVSALAGV